MTISASYNLLFAAASHKNKKTEQRSISRTSQIANTPQLHPLFNTQGLLDQAHKLYAQKNYQEAEQLFLKAYQENPALKVAFYNAASARHEYVRLLVEKNNQDPKRITEYEQAEKLYLKAKELNPRLPSLYNNLGAVYYYLSLVKKDRDYLTLASDNILKAIELDPNLAGPYFNNSLVEHAQGKYPAADIDFSKAMKLKIGKKYVAIGLFFTAERDFNLKNYPKVLQVLESIRQFNLPQSLQVKANYYYAYSNFYLGREFFMQNRFHQAISYLEKAQQFKTSLPDLDAFKCAISLGCSYLWLPHYVSYEELQKAKLYLTQGITLALKLKLDSGNVYYYRGMANALLKENKAALSDLDTYKTLLSKTSTTNDLKDYLGTLYFWYGYVYDNLNNLSEAYRFYTDSLKYEPKLVETYYNRGIILNKMNRPEEAAKDFKIASTIDPNFKLANSMLISTRFKERIKGEKKITSESESLFARIIKAIVSWVKTRI